MSSYCLGGKFCIVKLFRNKLLCYKVVAVNSFDGKVTMAATLTLLSTVLAGSCPPGSSVALDGVQYEYHFILVALCKADLVRSLVTCKWCPCPGVFRRAGIILGVKCGACVG